MDVIKEYLVSLGFAVNNNSLQQAQAAMKTAEGFVKTFASSSVTQFAIAGAGITAFFAAVEIGISEFLTTLARADLENEKFARQMWTSKENAMAFKNTLDAMGASLDDLYLSPELMNNFLQLRKQTFQMLPPKDYAEQMKFIRSIMYEFTRLKLEATYALQWIGYYLIKYLENPLKDLKINLKGLNDSIIKNMPTWTKKVAEFISYLARMGIAGAKGIGDLIKAFKSLPTELAVAGSAFVGFFALLEMGPIGWILAGMTALLLLLDDFYTYQKKDGGKSLFEDMWKGLEKVTTTLNESGVADEYMQSLNNLVKVYGDLGLALVDLGNSLVKLMGFKDLSDFFEKVLIAGFRISTIMVDDMTRAIKALTDLLKGDFKKAMDGIFSLERLKDLGGILGALAGKSAKSFEMPKDMFGPVKEFFDNAMKSFSVENSPINGMYKPQAYTLPGDYAAKNTAINQKNTYNIYGSEPYATAKAVSRNNDGLTIRALQGVFL